MTQWQNSCPACTKSSIKGKRKKGRKTDGQTERKQKRRDGEVAQ